jgi:hypothetical protein
VAVASRASVSSGTSSNSTPRRRAVQRAPQYQYQDSGYSGGGFFNFFSRQPVPPAPVGRRAMR